MTKAAIFPLVLFTTALAFSLGPIIRGDDDNDDHRAGPPKRDAYIEQMEEIEECFNAIKNGRAETEKYDDLAKSARRMQFLLEKVIPLTRNKLEQLGTAAEEPQFLEAKALMVESLAHAIGLEAALLAKNPELVKSRLRKLNHVRNNAHRAFQP